jgi:hypothetical protein
MGSLLSLNRDILKHIFRNYLCKEDRFLLWSAGMINCFPRNFLYNFPYNFIEYPIRNGYINIVKWTLNISKWKINHRILRYTVIYGQKDILQYFIETNICKFDAKKDYYNDKPLWREAASVNNIEILEYLKNISYVFGDARYPEPFDYELCIDNIFPNEETIKWLENNV